MRGMIIMNWFWNCDASISDCFYQFNDSKTKTRWSKSILYNFPQNIFGLYFQFRQQGRIQLLSTPQCLTQRRNEENKKSCPTRSTRRKQAQIERGSNLGAGTRWKQLEQLLQSNIQQFSWNWSTALLLTILSFFLSSCCFVMFKRKTLLPLWSLSFFLFPTFFRLPRSMQEIFNIVYVTLLTVRHVQHDWWFF